MCMYIYAYISHHVYIRRRSVLQMLQSITHLLQSITQMLRSITNRRHVVVFLWFLCHCSGAAWAIQGCVLATSGTYQTK